MKRFSDVKILLQLIANLMSKAEFETKIKTVLFEARERLERRSVFLQEKHQILNISINQGR